MSDDLQFNDLAEQALANVGRQCVFDDGGNIVRGERAAMIADEGEGWRVFRAALDAAAQRETGGVR